VSGCIPGFQLVFAGGVFHCFGVSQGMKSFLQRWLINTLAVLVAVTILGDHRIHYREWQDVLIASLLLGILNAFLRPLLLLLSLPLLIFTLGLFTLVINALLLYFVGNLWSGFYVADFWSAFWGALIISFVSLALNSLMGTGNARISVHRGKPPESKSKDDDEGGPLIDV
jgi:putative membrane protein